MDAHALLYRSHFGFGAQRLATAAGEDTSIAYGFLSTVLRLLELQQPPTHFAVVMDHHGKTFRCACLGAGSHDAHAWNIARGHSAGNLLHVAVQSALDRHTVMGDFMHTRSAYLPCRHELYSDYKAQRPPMPDGLKLAIPKIQKLLEVCSRNARCTCGLAEVFINSLAVRTLLDPLLLS